VSEPSLERVREIAGLLHAHADLDDPDLVRELQRQGLSADDAENAIIFLPLAFARPILVTLGVELSDEYCIRDDHGTWRWKKLSDESWYVTAARLAVATVTHGYAAEGCAGATLPKDVFTSVLSRSPEMGAANDALNAGKDVRGAVAGPVHLLRCADRVKPKRTWRLWR
jgi:hypothetical protein